MNWQRLSFALVMSAGLGAWVLIVAWVWYLAVERTVKALGWTWALAEYAYKTRLRPILGRWL